ncbi:GGDEF domain-containing protein [Dyella japonica]|uniref:GGDEF domain-containing protein n=1 Tax=Dyella japonica TaxID=231455 RepID=UPI0002E7E0EC|nr:GGDEF domain-containing protein [Dyella japonica]
MTLAWSRQASINRHFRWLVLAVYAAILPFAAWGLFHQWSAYREAEASAQDFDRFRAALTAMEQLSIERMATSQWMTQSADAQPDDHARIDVARRALNARMDGLGRSMRAPACRSCDNLIASFDAARSTLADARARIDAILATAPPLRSVDGMNDAMAHLTGTSSQLATFAGNNVSRSVQHDPDTVRYIYAASFAALLRDQAGQLGAQVSLALADHRRLSPDELRHIEQTTGEIRLLDWLSTTVVQERASMSDALVRHVDSTYMRDGLDYAQAVVKQNQEGGQHTAADQFRQRYIAYLAPIATLRDEALRLGSATLQADEGRQRLRLIVIAAAFVLLTSFLWLVTRQFHRKIVLPFVAARRIALELATNHAPTRPDNARYRGEIRDLFTALGVLSDNNQRRLELERERERLIGELRHAAETDFLTGLLNRRAFHARALQMLSESRAAGDWLAFTAFDVDHFKRINDTYGHEAGDLALKKLAELCGETWRTEDLVARTGGEEFAAIARIKHPDQSTTAARRLMERLHRETILTADGRRFSMTASFGVTVTCPDDAPSLDSLLRSADSLLYRAKERGRDRIEAAPFQQDLAGATDADRRSGL